MSADQQQQEQRYDEVLLGLAAQHGGIEPLLKTFFSFLHRKTDFYCVFPEGTQSRMGFSPGAAEQLLLRAFRSFPPKAVGGSGGGGGGSQQGSSSNVSPTTAPTTAPAPPSSAPTLPTTAPATTTPSIRLTAKGKQVPIGNGGATARYHWTQTLQDVTVYVDTGCPGVKSKEVACSWTASTVKVAVRGTVLLEGALGGTVKTQESLWTLEGNGATLVLTLEKTVPTWWACVRKGDAEIDTGMVDSTRKVGEYDSETQGQLRKIMFDQQQKAQGLPTSDELTMQEMLAKAKLLPGSPFLGEGGQRKEDDEK